MSHEYGRQNGNVPRKQEQSPAVVGAGASKVVSQQQQKGYGATMATGKQQKPKIYGPNGFKQNQCVD